MLGYVQSLNTLAVSMIDESDHEDSIEVLNEAVTLLSGCATTPVSHPTPNELLCIYSSSSMNDEPCATRGDFFFNPFSFEFEASKQEDMDEIVTDKQRAIAAIICLFNRGLCHQLLWSEDKQSISHLHSALRNYEEAYSLLPVAVDGLRQHNGNPLMKVLMAVCTNASFCSSELAEWGRYKFWNDQLRNVMRLGASGDDTRFFAMHAFFHSFHVNTAQAA